MNKHVSGLGLESAEGVARSDARATNSAAARELYKARVPIYPKAVKGGFRSFKWAMMAFTLSIYYIVPWLRWDRGPFAPDQAVLVDLAHQRFYFFFIEIWPEEIYYVTGLLILAALGIFLSSALLGRVWCGYACPQTVWTDLYLTVERFIEGDRSAQIRLAKEPWTARKMVKKIEKHVLWLLIAMGTGGAWVFYFSDAPTLARELFNGTAAFAAYASVAFLTFTTYVLAGYMREQVCTYMCPWPRIQAALTDAQTLMVTYRDDRGEPRGAHRRGEPWEGRGDCIDCNQCVAACPMGIDIRDGAQLECINCALCIDACDDVMTRIGRPKGLIGYDTDLNKQRRLAHEKPRWDFIRPRTILYAALLTLVGGIMLYGLANRSTLTLDVLRDRNPTFVQLSDGSVRNAYTLKLANRFRTARSLQVSFKGLEHYDVKIIGEQAQSLPAMVEVTPDKMRALRVLITLHPQDIGKPVTPVAFALTDLATGETAEVSSVFLAGRRHR